MIDYSITIMSAKPGTKKADVQETKAYGSAQVREKLDLNKFAKHITDHGCAYDRGDVSAILTKAVDCLREMMLAGNKVTLGELGSFYPHQGRQRPLGSRQALQGPPQRSRVPARTHPPGTGRGREGHQEPGNNSRLGITKP